MDINQATSESVPLEHFCYITGKIGRVKVLDHFTVLAGDDVNYNLTGTVELSKLRRSIVLDPKVDICTYYIPFRHIYGDEWMRMIKSGGRGTFKFNTTTVPEDGIMDMLRLKSTNKTEMHDHYYRAYLNIYNNYFINPVSANTPVVQSFSTLSPNTRQDGMKACHLPSIWTAPLPSNDDVRDTFDVSQGLDLYSLQAAFADLNNDQERLYFNKRYRDLMEARGGFATPDAEERPFFLGHSSFYSSGYNAMGTDQVSTGQLSGMVQFPFNHDIPRYHAPEHGIIMTVAVMRFDPIHEEEQDPMFNLPITYDNFVADPVVASNSPPRDMSLADFMANGSEGDRVSIAHDQWFRTCPNYVDSRFSHVKGFPFLVKQITKSNNIYVESEDYNHIFSNSALGHWQMIFKSNTNIYRNLPTTYQSIMTSNG